MLKSSTKKAVNIVYCLFCFLALCTGEQVTHYKEKNVQLSLQPETPLCERASEYWSESKKSDPVFVAETTYEFEKKPDSMERVSRIMRAFSTMQGITYYSNLKKKNCVLYPQCYTISNPSSKKAVSDDASKGSIDGKTLYFYQEDNSFGASVYKADYTQTENEIMLHMENQQAMSFGLIKAVKPENLFMTLVVSEQYDKMVLYILVQADVVSIPLIDSYVVNSFNARLDAISAWFRTEYEK